MKVPCSRMIGRSGAGFMVLSHVMRQEILYSFMANVGQMKRRLDRCIRHVRQRRQFGRPIGDFQAVSTRIADMKMRYELSRTYLLHAALRQAQNKDVTSEIAIAKAFVSESALKTAIDAVHIHGGQGYLAEAGLAREVADAGGGLMAAPLSPPQALAETPVLDFGHPDLQRHLDWVLSDVEDSPRARAVAIYYAVRDGISYQVFDTDLSPAGLRGSAVLSARKGFCLHKAILFATLCRGAGIPARIASARVCNHVSSPNLAKLVGGEIFLHWFNEVDLGAGWIKAAPIFNKLLCQLYRIPPLEFDGSGDAFVQGHVGAAEMRYLEPPQIFEAPSAAELIAHVGAHRLRMVTAQGRIPSEREIARL